MVRRKSQVEDGSRHAFVELFPPSLEKRWHSGEEAAERIGKDEEAVEKRGEPWREEIVEAGPRTR